MDFKNCVLINFDPKAVVENEHHKTLKDFDRKICEKEVDNVISNGDGEIVSSEIMNNFPIKGIKFFQEIRPYLESSIETEAIQAIEVLEQTFLKKLKYFQEIRQYLESSRDTEAIQPIEILEQIFLKKVIEEPSRQPENIDLMDKFSN